MTAAVPGIAEIERALGGMRRTLDRIAALYRDAHEIAYALETSGSARGSGAATSDPTAATLMAGLLNAEDDDADRWSPERVAIREAVAALTRSAVQMDRAVGMLVRIKRLDERR